MLRYGCFKWAPNTVFEDPPEIQLWCRIIATTSQSHIELSPNASFGVRSFNANEEESK